MDRTAGSNTTRDIIPATVVPKMSTVTAGILTNVITQMDVPGGASVHEGVENVLAGDGTTEIDLETTGTVVRVVEAAVARGVRQVLEIMAIRDETLGPTVRPLENLLFNLQLRVLSRLA